MPGATPEPLACGVVGDGAERSGRPGPIQAERQVLRLDAVAAAHIAHGRPRMHHERLRGLGELTEHKRARRPGSREPGVHLARRERAAQLRLGQTLRALAAEAEAVNLGEPPVVAQRRSSVAQQAAQDSKVMVGVAHDADYTIIARIEEGQGGERAPRLRRPAATAHQRSR